MKRLISFMLAVFMVMSVAPLSLAVPPMKDAELDPVLNAEGGSIVFDNDVEHPWTVVEKDGLQYAKSNIKDMHNTTTAITATVEIVPYTTLSFDYVVSTETSYDKLIVQCVSATGKYVTVCNASGDESRTIEYTFAEALGAATLRFAYSKDSSASRGDDCVYIRNVRLTPPGEPEGMSIVEHDFKMMPNMHHTLNVAYEPVGTYAEVEWESSNSEIMTVRNGLVKAIAPGIATITARYGDIEASVDIEVTNDVPYVDGFRAMEYGTNARQPALVRHWMMGPSVTGCATFSQDLSFPEELVDKLNVAKSAEYVNDSLYVVLDKTLYCVDTANGTYSEVSTYGDIESLVELTYDYANERMLVWVRQNSSTEYLGELNLETGEITTLTAIPSYSINAFAAGPDGTAYVMLRGSNGAFATIDLTTGDTQSLFDTNISSSYMQSLTYNSATGKFYWAAPTYYDKSIYEIDPVAQTATMIEQNAGSLVGLHVGGHVDVVDTAAEVTGVTLDKTEITVEMGKSEILVATVEPENAGVKDVIWESSNDEIATVQSGVVRGIAAGDAVITVRTVEGDFTATCNVTVIEPLPVAVTGVTLNKTDATIKIGRTLQLEAMVHPGDAANKTITWSSSNEEVATVENGLVEAISGGNAIITVTTEDGGFTATCDVTVSGPVDPNINPLYQDFEEGLDGWTFIDADGDGYNWELGSSSGSPTLPYEGEEMIMSKSYVSGMGGLDPDNWMISPEFTISANATSVSLSWIAGAQMTYFPENYSVYIASGDPVVETFTEDTLIFNDAAAAMADKQVDISAYAGQTVRVAFRHHNSFDKVALNIDLIKVTQEVGGDTPIVIPVTGVELDTVSTEMIVGVNVTLTATVLPENATNKNVTWSSSNNTVATVNENGVVTSHAVGTAVITVTTEDGGFTDTCEVEVTGSIIPPTPEGYYLYEDFEDELVGWTNIDADGDGNTWMPLSIFGLDNLEGNDSYTSQSYSNSVGAFDPDNWLISPEFTIEEGAENVILSWMAASQDPDWLDHYSVYIGVGDAVPETFSTVLYTGTAPGVADTFRVDLSSYAGQTVRIAFRHHDSEDCYMLNIDLITVAPDSEPVYVPVTGVSLNETTANLNIGDNLALVATVLPENATNKNVTWASSNNAVATVNDNGYVTAVSAGTATITVRTEDGGYTYVCVVTVADNTPSTVPVTGVTLNMTSAELTVGDTAMLAATVSPADATNKNVTWSSSNNSVAQVINGLVAAVGVGNATITVTTEDGGFTAECEVTVAPMTIPVTGVVLDITEAELLLGETTTLTATVLPTSATNKSIIWSSSNEAVATVENGVVTAVTAGRAIITVVTVDGSFSAICNVTVIDPDTHPETITLDVVDTAMFIGDEITITATITPDDVTNSEVIWTSSNENVVTVENGVVTAIGRGEATITVTTVDGGLTATCTVRVYRYMGDINNDGLFNTGDAVALLRILAGVGNEYYAAELVDYTNDGNVNTGDAVAILRVLAGLDDPMKYGDYTYIAE